MEGQSGQGDEAQGGTGRTHLGLFHKPLGLGNLGPETTQQVTFCASTGRI